MSEQPNGTAPRCSCYPRDGIHAVDCPMNGTAESPFDTHECLKKGYTPWVDPPCPQCERVTAESPRPDYDELDPGIRDTVQRLRDAGFETTDSGDGTSKPRDWYESGEALLFPHVVVVVQIPGMFLREADRMQDVLGPDWHIEASYSPKDKTMVIVASQPGAASSGVSAHLCAGCHHRWDGELKGAELCGDCWRKAQPIVHSGVSAARLPQAACVKCGGLPPGEAAGAGDLCYCKPDAEELADLQAAYGREIRKRVALTESLQQLRSYVQHKSNCFTFRGTNPECTCGLDAVLKAIGGE